MPRRSPRLGPPDRKLSLLSKFRHLARKHGIGARFRFLDDKTVEIISLPYSIKSVQQYNPRFPQRGLGSQASRPEQPYPPVKSLLNGVTHLAEVHHVNLVHTPSQAADVALLDYHGFRDEGETPYRPKRTCRRDIEAGWKRT